MGEVSEKISKIFSLNLYKPKKLINFEKKYFDDTIQDRGMQD